MTAMAYIWLVAAVILGIWEAMTTNLVSVWFVGGAIVAFLTALLGGGFLVQLALFTGVSALLLACMRPVLKKRLLVSHPIKTNADRIIGMTGVVTKPIDNRSASGAVKVGGMEWTARSQSGMPIAAGEQVKILRIDGVKVYVEPVGVPTEV